MEEPWGLNDDEPKYQPTTEDITDDESDPLLRQARMDGRDMKGSANDSEYSSGRKKEPYKCDRCEFATGDFMNFITHKNAHTEKEKIAASLFTCGMCEFATPNPKNMTQHIQKHMDEPDKDVGVATPTSVDADEDRIDSLEEAAILSQSSPDNPSDSEPPLLITEVKSAAKLNEIIPPNLPLKQDMSNTLSSGESLEDEHADAATKDVGTHLHPKGSELVVQSTIEVTSLPIEVTSENYDNVDREILHPDASIKSNLPVEIKPIAGLTSDEPLGESMEPSLNWVSVTEVQAKNAVQNLHSSPKNIEVTNEIADDSLIGYLELRRTKPAVPLSAKPVKQEKVIDWKTNDLPPLKKPKIEEDIVFSTVIETNYKHTKPVFVKYFVDKKKIVATDKGVKTVKQTIVPRSRPVKSANHVKQVVEKAKPPAKSKMPRSRDSSQNSPTRRSPVRSSSARNSPTRGSPARGSPTRVLASKSESSLNPTVNEPTRSTRSKGLPVEIAASATSKVKRMKIPTGSDNKHQVEIDVSQVRTRASAKPKEDSAVPVIDASKKSSTDVDVKIGEKAKSNATTSLSQLDTDIGVGSPKDDEQYSSVYLRLHKKPKKDLLLRYQSEMSRESLPNSPESSEEELNINKVIDIVTPTYHAFTKFQAAKEITIQSSTTAFEEAGAKELGNGHSCKIVLSRCSVIDHMGSGPLTPKIALKLKSSLRDCWQKVLMKSSSPNEDLMVPFPQTLQEPQTSQHRKRKLLMQEDDSLNNTKKLGKVYKCEFCDYSTGDKDELFSHSHEQHTEEEKMYICDKCDYITSRQSKLISHAKAHQQTIPQSEQGRAKLDKELNGTCNGNNPQKPLAGFSSNKNIRSSIGAKEQNNRKGLGVPNTIGRHSQEDKRPYACKLCPYRAARVYNLRAHERSHKGTSKEYKCKHCSFASPKWGEYIDHQLQSHKSKSELSCHNEECQFTTSNPNVLTSHRLLHKVIPQHICEQCDYTTFRKDFFDKHCSRHHSGDATINNKLKLRYRTSTVPKEQPFKCVICWYSARDSKTLAKHMQIHATKARGKFLCGTCQFETNSSFAIKKHLKNSTKCEKILNGVDS